ncbi:MAG: ABC transporter permease [Chitinophagaceae bacterium]
MIKNYFKVAIRYLLRNKGYTAINVFGLSIGVTCCVLMMLFVRSEWSYDKFHTKADRIYRLWQEEKYDGQNFINTVTPLSAATVIQATYPEVESTCRVFATDPIIKVGQNSFTDAVRMVDSSFFKVFDFEITQGSKQNPFPTANTVLLTNETAKKYFGSSEAIGQNIEMQLGNEKVLFTVGGIVKKAPEESSIKYNLLICYANAKFLFGPGAFKNWFNVQSESYVLLRHGTDAGTLEKKFHAMIKQYLGEDYKEGTFFFHLQPAADIHLNNILPEGNETTSNPKYSYILGTIGILVLLIACINFIVLSVGRSTTRAMEVGVRKVMGAERQQLIRQFWGEAFIMTTVAVIIGLMGSVILLKPFNEIVQRNLSLQVDTGFLFFCILLIGLIAVIAGIYPAIILSGFKPVEVLKGKLKMKANTGWLRRSLIVGQFSASIILIICTIAVGKQMNYMADKDLGYQKEKVVVVATSKSLKEGIPLANLYRTVLLKNPQVIDAAVSVYSFAETPWVEIGFTDDKKVYRSFQYNAIDPNFIPAMQIKMAAGRSFTAGNAADFSSAAIVNEAFVKQFKLTDPIGKKLPGPFDQRIVGVVKDFNYMSLRDKVRPLMMTIQHDSVVRRTENISFTTPPQPHISIRLKPGNISKDIAALGQAWKTIAPGRDFDFKFLDESLAALYKTEQRTSTIVKIASILSIFIACMGLFGLATLTVARRTKEIGIRKVLGADVTTIVGLLSKEFVKLVVIAALIAFPLAAWFISDWLKDFAYQTTVSWWIYGLAGLVALLIALMTIGLQTIKAALMNPVKSLRTE